MLSAEGRCLCGDIKVTAENINPKFTVCHCDSCRQWGGSALFALQCGTQVKFENVNPTNSSNNIKIHPSSEWASRGFCGNCGSHLFYMLNETGEYNIPVGIFQGLDGLEMDMQYFSDQRPNYYCFSNTTKEMTKADIMAYFAQKS
ncbi:GFA family protein [Alteromonas sp. 1_MG-2023]|uniref:GFA family protein n=1 Tax=Alteromonas sp. 1_MG-2023 TaxID=3062669 RepID=UPI0026E1EE7A|nr:GFA family protein [Alteromonas sp. 1_MG-2023]MDO6565463.1 GFA family protein [Alteromonas sp. 1_MG-2023]